MTEIQDGGHFYATMRRGKAEVVHRIVRNCERMKVDFTDPKVLARIDLNCAMAQNVSPPAGLIVSEVPALTDVGLTCLAGHINRAVQIFHQYAHPAGMIAMLMRD